MNKKQLIVMWILGILVIFVIIINGFEYQDYYKRYSTARTHGWYFSNKPDIRIILSSIILGGLLIYTFRDGRKKT